MGTALLTVDGTYGAIAHEGTGAAATPGTTKPLVDADVRLVVAVGGSAVSWSLDDGESVGGTLAASGGATVEIPSTGISVRFASGSLVAGDVYRFATRAGFRSHTVMTREEVDFLEQRYPGFLAMSIRGRSAEIRASLAKRYGLSADAAHPPAAVVRWLVDVVTLDAYIKRGFNPSSQQDQLVADAATRAWARVTEAADAEKGLIDLPLTEAKPGASGIALGGALSESQSDPYAWLDEQRRARGGW